MADAPVPPEDAIRTQYLREFIEHPAGTFGAPQREKAESCLNGLLSALSAARERADQAEARLEDCLRRVTEASST